MSKRSGSSLGFNLITCWSVTHWASTPHGMQCAQRKKTAGTVRPLERGARHFLTVHFPLLAPGTPSCSTRSMRTKASACGPMRSRTDTMSSLLLLAGKAETFDAEEVLDDFDAELTSTPLYARIKC